MNILYAGGYIKRDQQNLRHFVLVFVDQKDIPAELFL